MPVKGGQAMSFLANAFSVRAEEKLGKWNYGRQNHGLLILICRLPTER